MKTRVITGSLLALFFIPLFIFGGFPLEIVLTILTIVATFEMGRLFKLKKYVIGIIAAYSGLFFILFLGYFDDADIFAEMIIALVIFTIIIGALLSVFDDEFKTSDMGLMLVAILYPSVGFASIGFLTRISVYNIGFLFLITTMTDIFAYIVGVNFGKTRLAVKISPKKSVEGSIGGTVFAVIFTRIYVWGFKMDSIANIELNIGISIGLIIFLSVIGQIGDLVASKFKRDFGVKDYSNIFPGHGGVMDRFDSVIFAGMVLVFISEVVGLL